MADTWYGELRDHYGVQQYMAPNGEVCSVPLYKLTGDTFFDTILDTTRWTPSAGTGGTVGVSGGQLVMSTGTTANNATSLTTVHTARFSGLAPNKLRTPLRCPDGGTVNNVRRWGNYTATDGAFFELNGATLKCVTRKASTDSAISSGAFNGQYGAAFSVGTTSHFFEIIYQPRQVMFIADNKIVHTLSVTGAPWTETLHLPTMYENNNTNGSTTDVALHVRLGTTARFGIPEIQKDGILQEGTTAGLQLKYGPGNLHGLIVSGVSNLANITLYDGTSTAGVKLFTTGTMGAQTIPLALQFYGEAFNNGLFLTITGAAANAHVTFD